MDTKFFFYYEIVINILVSSFRFIWIPVFWVYGHCKYFHFFQRGDRLSMSESDDFRRQNLTSKVGLRAERVNQVHNGVINPCGAETVCIRLKANIELN